MSESGSIDMGYEEIQPATRRGSMTPAEERERRASIKAILADDSISALEKRRSIQHLMDGRRASLSNTGSTHSSRGSIGSNPHDLSYSDMGYGDETCTVIEPICNDRTKRMEQSRPPCSHYVRKCTMIAPCCGAAFGCRICHDDCPVLPPKIQATTFRLHQRTASLPSSFTSMPTCAEDTHHTIDRFTVRQVICRECFTQQSSKT